MPKRAASSITIGRARLVSVPAQSAPYQLRISLTRGVIVALLLSRQIAPSPMLTSSSWGSGSFASRAVPQMPSRAAGALCADGRFSVATDAEQRARRRGDHDYAWPSSKQSGSKKGQDRFELLRFCQTSCRTFRAFPALTELIHPRENTSIAAWWKALGARVFARVCPRVVVCEANTQRAQCCRLG